MHLLSALLLALSSNIDNFAVAIAFGVKRIRIGILSNLVIAIVTGIGTFLSLSAGQAISKYLPDKVANVIGSVVLVGIGLWVIWEALELKKKRKRNKFQFPDTVGAEDFYEKFSYEGFLEKPERADTDKSGYIDVKESIALALGLTLNNLVVGVGGGISGLSVAITIFLSVMFSMLAIILGYSLGEQFRVKISIVWIETLSGILILVLGVYEYFVP